MYVSYQRKSGHMERGWRGTGIIWVFAGVVFHQIQYVVVVVFRDVDGLTLCDIESCTCHACY